MIKVRMQVDVADTALVEPEEVETCQTELLDPARSIIEMFGGCRVVAEICGVHPSRVYRWQRPASVNGTGGFVPQRHHQALIRYARENGLPFDPVMLIKMPAAA